MKDNVARESCLALWERTERMEKKLEKLCELVAAIMKTMMANSEAMRTIGADTLEVRDSLDGLIEDIRKKMGDDWQQ